MVNRRREEVSQYEVIGSIVIDSGTRKHRCELRWDENVPGNTRSNADPVMQPHISYIVLPVDVIEGDLNSLSPCGYSSEDTLYFVRLLFDDASESRITA